MVDRVKGVIGNAAESIEATVDHADMRGLGTERFHRGAFVSLEAEIAAAWRPFTNNVAENSPNTATAPRCRSGLVKRDRFLVHVQSDTHDARLFTHGPSPCISP